MSELQNYIQNGGAAAIRKNIAETDALVEAAIDDTKKREQTELIVGVGVASIVAVGVLWVSMRRAGQDRQESRQDRDYLVPNSKSEERDSEHGNNPELPTADELEEKLYADALEELNSGNVRQGVWGKALVAGDGDNDKARARYIAMRVKAELGAIAPKLASVSQRDEAPGASSVLSDSDVHPVGASLQNEGFPKNAALPVWVWWAAIVVLGLIVKFVILGFR